MTKRNRVKEKLQAGKTVAFINPDHPDPSLVEHLGRYGVDAVFIDTELQSPDFQTVENLRRAADVGGMTTIVRPTTDEPWLIQRYIACGIGGVKVPHIETAAQAERLVKTVRRALRDQTEDFVTVAMIESMEGVKNAAEILKVDGIDVFFVGPGDLSNTMGGRAKADGMRNAEVVSIVYPLLDQIVAAGRIAGTTVAIADTLTIRSKGVLFIYEHLDTLMAKGVKQFVKEATGERA